MKKLKLIKDKCEVESCQVCDPKLLQLHHIIERTEENTNNHNSNLAILCANHHLALHTGSLKIIGIFPSTRLPNKRTLIYELNGIKNIEVNKPYIEFTNKSFKI